MNPLSIEAIRADVSAAAPGLLTPDGLTWNRLGENHGVLHLGGPDGIVYSACCVASIEFPGDDERDRTLEFLAKAPARLSVLLDDLDYANQNLAQSRAATKRHKAIATDAKRNLEHATKNLGAMKEERDRLLRILNERPKGAL